MRLSSTLLALGAAAVLCGGLVGCTPTEQSQPSESSAANAPAGNTPETPETASSTTLEVPEGMETAVLNAKGMTWPAGWPPKVEKALVRVDGFQKMKADVTTQTVEVVYDPAKTNPEALATAITDHTDFEGSVASGGSS